MAQPHLVTRRRPPLLLASLLLALAVGLGAVGQTPFAQAAPAPDYSKNVYLVVSKAGSAERTICVGDKLAISARMLTVVDVLNDPNAEKQFAALYGVPLQATVTNPSVGAISPAAAVTTAGGSPAGQVDFTFIAKQPGATTVQIDAQLIHKQVLGVTLSSDTVTGQLALTVEKCAYRVDATAVWHQAGNITLLAEITNAALVAQGDGTYAGNGDVKWFGATGYPPPCRVLHHPAPSRVYITGELIGRDLLEVNLTFEATPAMLSTLICPKANSVEMFGSQMLTPESLRLWVLSVGGTARRKPDLGGVQILDGTAIVTVLREKGG